MKEIIKSPFDSWRQYFVSEISFDGKQYLAKMPNLELAYNKEYFIIINEKIFNQVISYWNEVRIVLLYGVDSGTIIKENILKPNNENNLRVEPEID